MIFPAPLRNLRAGIFTRWTDFDARSHFPWITMTIAGIAILSSALPSVADLLIYHRAGIQSGESWRLMTGQLVHASPMHLILSIGGFLAWGAICEAWHRRIYPYFLGVMALLTGGVLYFQSPDLESWCGLSALCTATFIWAGGICYKVGRRRKMPALSWIALLSALGLIAKVVYESFAGTPLLPTHFSGGYFTPPFVSAFGTLLGGTAYLVTQEKVRRPKRRAVPLTGSGSRSMSLLSRT